MTTSSLVAAAAEPLLHVTKMTRCRVCGMAFATANPEPEPRTACAETCPAGHDGQYDGADYYHV
jgi:hypothetical protein